MDSYNYEWWGLTYEHFYFVIKTSIKVVGFFYVFIYFYDTFIKSFLPSFFFLRKWLCNCYHKFYLMLRLVMVCRPAKALIFYSGRPDVCTAMIIIIIIVIIIMIIIRQTLMDNTVTENSSSFHCGSC